MSQWNLNVRLTGQGSDLTNTLRGVTRDADDAARSINDLRRDIAELRRDARRPIRVRIDVDAADLRNDVRTALTTAGAGQGLTVDLRLGNAMDLRREVEAAVRWAAWGHRITIPIGLADPMQLRRDVSAAVRWASDSQTIRVRVVPDTSALRTLGGTIPGGGGGGSGGGMGRHGLQTLITMAPAAIPLIAGLTQVAAPLAGTLTAAGGAAAAFGIALAGQIGPMSELADAEKKYQEAVREHGRTSQKAAEAQAAYLRQLAQMPPETQAAAIALSGLKSEFKDWSADMASFTMAPVEKSFTVIEQLLPHLSPQVEAFSGTLDRLMNVAGGSINTPGFDALSNKVAELTEAKLDDFTDQVIHLMRVVSEGDADAGLLGQILGYIEQHGPAGREALNALADAIGNVLEGASIAGPSLLTLVTAAARLVAALPPELVAIVIQLAAAFKLLQLAGLAAAATAAGVTRLSAAITALAATSTAAGGGIAGLRAALLSLSTAAKASIVVAAIAGIAYAVSELTSLGQEAPADVDKLTTSLGKLGATGKLTGEGTRVLGENFSKLHDNLSRVADPSVSESIANWGADVTNGFLRAGDSTEELIERMDGVDDALTELVRSGNAELAAAAIEHMTKNMNPKQLKEFKNRIDNYKEGLADAKFEADAIARSIGVFGKAAQETKAKLDGQKASADALRQSIMALNDVNRAAGSAMSAFEQSLDDVAKATKDHQNALKMRDGELDLGEPKARAAEKVLSDLAGNTMAAAAAAREQNKSWEHVNGILTEGRAALIQAADAMGLTKEQAEALADSYLSIPEKKSLTMDMRIEDAVAGLDSVIAAIEKTPDAKSVTVKALTADAQEALRAIGFTVVQMPDGTFQVTADTKTAEQSLKDVKKARDGIEDKSITIDASTNEVVSSLELVQAKVRSTNGKTITMKAPTAEARKQLELLGFKIRDTKGKNVVITVPTGSQRSNVAALKSLIDSLRNKTITVTTHYRITGNQARLHTGAQGSQLKNARGGVWDYYADGGIRAGRVTKFAAGGMAGDRANQHVAQIAPAGSWRVWAEPETGGESYIPLSPSKRPRSRAIAEETVRRLGGDPRSIAWNANGSVTDWRYDPQTGSLYSASDAGSAGNKTKKVKVKVKGKWQTKEVEYFDIGAVEKKLKSASKATAAWNADLEKVADRVGSDVAQALASMGKEGEKLADKMARGSTKYINEMAAALRGLQKQAKASLTDYTRQLGNANKLNKTFSDNLATLAARGYGDLAKQLAAQNDEAAQQLAAAAVKDNKKASSANSAAKTANNALTSEQVQDLVAIIAAIRTAKTGIHDVAATTGLGEDDIIATATKATSQIRSALGGRAEKFLADLAKANKGMAYANGGIRSGIYATRAGAVTFAEPSTGGEAYIPLGGNKRRTALPVLADVAGRFGLGLRDASEGRVIIIREQGPLVGSQTWNVTTGGDAAATARRIDADNAYQLRRLARGGVAAR